MPPIWKYGLHATKSETVEIFARSDAAFLRWPCINDDKLHLTLCRNFSASSPGSATTNTSFCQLHKQSRRLRLNYTKLKKKKKKKAHVDLNIEPRESF